MDQDLEKPLQGAGLGKGDIEDKLLPMQQVLPLHVTEAPLSTSLRSPRSTSLRFPSSTSLRSPLLMSLRSPRSTSLRSPRSTSLRFPPLHVTDVIQESIQLGTSAVAGVVGTMLKSTTNCLKDSTSAFPKSGVLPKPFPRSGVLPKPFPRSGVLKKPFTRSGVLKKPFQRSGVPKKPFQRSGVLPKPFPRSGVLPKPFPRSGVLPKPFMRSGVLKKPFQRWGMASRQRMFGIRVFLARRHSVLNSRHNGCQMHVTTTARGPCPTIQEILKLKNDRRFLISNSWVSLLASQLQIFYAGLAFV